MRYEMKMPDLAATESEIRIARWIVGPGQMVSRGQPLLEVETDKATMDVESAVNGVLQEVRSPAAAAVSVGQVIAVLEVEQSGVAEVNAQEEANIESTVLAGSCANHATPAVQSSVAPVAGARPASGMFARNRAAAARPARAVCLSAAERTAAKRLSESKRTIPHFYLQTSINAARIIARRKAAEPSKLVWDAFFVAAAAKAITHYERFRCRFDGETLIAIDTDAIGVAVDVEGELYVVPIDAPTVKTLEQISAVIRQYVERLRAGDSEAKRVRPTLMTITNLGVCEIEGFIPIINPPEPAILGIGRVAHKVVASQDGRIGVEPRCTLTLSVDHRVAGGRYAAEFLGQIVQELESF